MVGGRGTFDLDFDLDNEEKGFSPIASTGQRRNMETNRPSATIGY
jgi:hypothetical protein